MERSISEEIPDPMDTSTIELPGLEIDEIKLEDGVLAISFSRAIIIKTMTGSADRTRWWQAGSLVFEDARVFGDIPVGPLVCSGGDVGENVYTYRDMIPLSLDSRGRTHCRLRFKGREGIFEAEGATVRLEMDDRPHYIEHIRPGKLPD